MEKRRASHWNSECIERRWSIKNGCSQFLLFLQPKPVIYHPDKTKISILLDFLFINKQFLKTKPNGTRAHTQHTQRKKLKTKRISLYKWTNSQRKPSAWHTDQNFKPRDWILQLGASISNQKHIWHGLGDHHLKHSLGKLRNFSNKREIHLLFALNLSILFNLCIISRSLC